jgi:transposase
MSTCTALVPVERITTEELLANPVRLLCELFQARQQANYWKALFQRGKRREAKLQRQIGELEARVKQLEHELFGKKSEKKNRPETSSSDGEKRRRGQQPDNPAPKRRSHDHLPIIEEPRDLPEDQKRCPQCGLPYERFPGTEDSETIEIEVRAHRRVIRRQRYRPVCPCPGNSGIITASRSPKLIPKGRYGISVWTQVLLDKFLFFRPSHRLIADLATHGIELPPGTLAGGLRRIAPMLELLYHAIEQHCQDATHWHADETGWKVFVKVEEKPGHRRTLWVYRSCEAIFFAIALTKGAKEAEAFFGADAEGILNVDRASNYKALRAVKAGTLLLAFCWTHTRRDFLDAVRGDPGQQDWAEPWIQRIGELFHLNKRRVAIWKRDPQGPEFAEHDAVLRACMEDFRIARDEELKQEKQPAVRKRILTSLVNHWDGLTIFVDHPDVPMDNSEAERRLRGPAMGRKNYWGSGAKWAGELAERCFSLFATLMLAGINVRTWLTAYLTACAEVGGQAPAWAVQLLPWNLSPSGRQAFQQPLRGNVLSDEVRCYLDALAEQGAESTSAEVPLAKVPAAEVPPAAEPPPSPFSKGTRRRRLPVFPLTYSGRQFSQEQLQQVRALIAASPNSSRTAISRQVCQLLNWRKPDGGWKEVSCRVALLRMHEDGWLVLPPPRCKSNNGRRTPARTQAAEPQTLQEFSLAHLGRPRLELVTRERSALWNEHIDRYHYLGYAPLVGAQLRYFAYAGDRLLALFGYGASAWRLTPRDRWIGWSDAQRQAALPRVVAQVRFLILPWIRCSNLASKLLSLSATQLPADWEQHYGIRPWLLESFVDTSRFDGICYRAANWIDVGQTQGRGKKDRHRRISLPKKQVFLYPLCQDCRKRFTDENSGQRGQPRGAHRPQSKS